MSDVSAITSAQSSAVRIFDSGAVRLILLNRRGAGCEDDLRMVEATTFGLRARPESIRSIVIAGRDDSGVDVGSGPQSRTGDASAALVRAGEVMTDRIAAVPIPVVVASERVVLGMGLELALAADIVVAGIDADFGFPEARRGMVPSRSSIQRLISHVGTHRAKEMLFFGAVIGAQEAHRLGVVNEVVHAGTAQARAMELATELAAAPTEALAAMKDLVKRAQGATAADAQQECLRSGSCDFSDGQRGT